jgi:hypothetical protein
VYGYSLDGQYVATATMTTRRRMITTASTLLQRRPADRSYVT